MSLNADEINPKTYETRWLLCFYFFLLTFLSTTSHHVLKPVWKIVCRSLPEERPIRDEIHSIKLEQQELSIKDNFAAHSKLQRKINKLDDELKEIVKTRMEKNVKIKFSIQYGFNIFLNILLFVSLVYVGKAPLIVLKQNLFPFESLLSYPSGVPHAIVPHAWALLSRVSCHTVAKAITKIQSCKNEETKA